MRFRDWLWVGAWIVGIMLFFLSALVFCAWCIDSSPLVQCYDRHLPGCP